MDARPAVMRQWLDRKAISQGAPQKVRKQGGTVTRTAQTPECDGVRERRGLTGRLPAPRSQKRPDDQTGEVKPGRGSHNQPRVRTPREGQGRSQSELNHGENWKTQPSWEPQKFPRGTAPLDPTVTLTDPEEEEKPTLR